MSAFDLSRKRHGKLLWRFGKVMDTQGGVHDSFRINVHSGSSVLQCQLVERAAAVGDTGGGAVAAVDGYPDELVSVRYQAFIRKGTVVIGSCGCIRCTEGVQDLEAAVFPEAVNHAVPIRASGLGVRAESPMWPES